MTALLRFIQWPWLAGRILLPSFAAGLCGGVSAPVRSGCSGWALPR